MGTGGLFVMIAFILGVNVSEVENMLVANGYSIDDAIEHQADIEFKYNEVVENSEATSTNSDASTSGN